MHHSGPAASTPPAASREAEPVVETRNHPAARQQENAAQPDSGIPAAIHQSYKAAAAGVTGKVLKCGTAPFRFEPGESQSSFITLRTREGKQTFWGKELAGLIRETRIQPGRMATLTWLGKEAVTVQVPQKDDQGVVTHFESKTAHRNQWSLTPTGVIRYVPVRMMGSSWRHLMRQDLPKSSRPSSTSCILICHCRQRLRKVLAAARWAGQSNTR